ncbi:MAG: orotate phosphoribosyltransferase [Bacteroidales bacterium]
MTSTKEQVAAYLLQSKAVILQPDAPFTWASGWNSPIYCDNRVTLSYPHIRSYIKEAFVQTIREHFPETGVIAGVATGAIAQGALVAEAMELPFVYVRASAKEHGRKNLVEGRLEPGKPVLVIEDLVSTGGSSLKAVEALRSAGARVLGMVAIFSYGFPQSEEHFREAGIALHTLSDYSHLIQKARESGYVSPSHLDILEDWRENPSAWNPR